MVHQFLLTTSNLNKVREFQQTAKQYRQVAVRNWVPDQDVPETGDTFLANARIKAEALLQAGPLPQKVDFVIGEDSGLVVHALNGTENISPFPGLKSNRWLTPTLQKRLGLTPTDTTTADQRNAALLQLMEGKNNRTAEYVCAIACFDVRNPKTPVLHQTEGRVKLTVAHSPRGENGFAYDKIMKLHPDEGGDGKRTFSELKPEEKNRYSHRSRAIANLMQQLFPHPISD
jgi:XTP/dITP diphosphohydrolase